jgi:hypothetical protein
MGFFRGLEPFSSESCAIASIGLNDDIMHARTAVKRAATTNSAFLFSVLNWVLLDPVIYFQSNGVFQFLANFREAAWSIPVAMPLFSGRISLPIVFELNRN